MTSDPRPAALLMLIQTSCVGTTLHTYHAKLRMLKTLHTSKLAPANASEVLDIKRGAWPLDKVKAEAERLFQLAQEAYVRSALPAEPKRPRAERVCVEMISECHNLRVT
jgi:hypothetical protein